MENICYELRYLPDARGLARDHALLLLCDLSHSNPDAVDVAIVSPDYLRHNEIIVRSDMFQTAQCCSIMENVIKAVTVSLGCRAGKLAECYMGGKIIVSYLICDHWKLKSILR